MILTIRADQVRPGDVLRAVHADNGWGPTRVRRGVVQSVEPGGGIRGIEPYVLLRTAPYGGPIYCIDTILEVERT